MQRITLSIDDDLADFFVRYAEERGYRNRSEAMRDILRNLASRKELEDPAPGTLCVGVASYIYDHHERQLAMRLTELQHEHGDLVISQMHAHVNGDDCLETVFLRARRSRQRFCRCARRRTRRPSRPRQHHSCREPGSCPS